MTNHNVTIDDRILQDLTDLYHNGAEPGEIQAALHLNGLIQADDGQMSFATRALPRYYYGDRKSKTVMVMLNPGSGVEKANHNLMIDLKTYSMKNAADINNYHLGCMNFGHLDKDRQDNFDLKEAFFLHKWKDNGIILPRNFSYKSDKQTLLDAKEIVLTQKLQLELIPYASRSFSAFNRERIHLIVPFLETVLNEIFDHERKYVIFCSKKFEIVFNEYNKQHPNTIHFDKKDVSFGKIGGSKISGSCSVITINYKCKHLKAIIANTFPHQALPNAYCLMEMYGDFCYHEYIKH